MRSRFLVLSLALPLSLVAQTRTLPEPEIGFRAGFARISMDDGAGGTDRVSFLTLPGAVLASPGGIHFTLFVSEKVALEPQLGFIRSSSSGFSSSLMFLALQPQLFLGPDARRAAYLFGHIGLLREANSGGGGSESQNVLGAGIGYRKVLRRVIATRYELRIRRFGENGPTGEATELALLFGFGAVIPRSGSQ